MTEPVLLPCRVTLADGTVAAGAFPPAAHTRAFLNAIVAHQEHVATWLEVPRGARIDDPVDRWTPREYFAALCGITEYDRLGKVRCPLPDHDDPRASLWIGETPDEGWFCFGCSRGGRIFDLASLLIGGPWGVDLRGDAFRAARAEIERRLGVPIPGR